MAVIGQEKNMPKENHKNAKVNTHIFVNYPIVQDIIEEKIRFLVLARYTELRYTMGTL